MSSLFVFFYFFFAKILIKNSALSTGWDKLIDAFALLHDAHNIKSIYEIIENKSDHFVV